MTNTPELYNEEAERGVLGACIAKPDIAPLVIARLQPGDFYMLRYQYVYESICELDRAGTAIDIITVSDRLRESGKLQHMSDGSGDGLFMVTNLIASAYRIEDVDEWCEIIRYHSLRRRLAQTADGLKGMALQGNVSSADLIAAVDKASIDMHSASPQKRMTFYERIHRVTDEMEEYLKDPNKLRGVPTGIADIDKFLGGWKPGTLNILAARPGMGKSAFMLNCALEAARAGLHVGVINLEMNDTQCLYRHIANIGSLNIKKLDDKRLTQMEWRAYLEAVGKLSSVADYIHDEYEGYMTPAMIRGLSIEWQMTAGLDVLFVDYMQLITPNPGKYDNQNIRIASISGAMLRLAKELNIPIVMLSQLSRGVEQRMDKRPLLSDLRDSGSIEQDAYTVSFLYRPAYYDTTADSHYAEFITAKNRQGATGMIPLHFDGQFMRFRNGELRRVELGAD